jgi:hypothetical protein
MGKKIKPSSCKAKGRKHQQQVRLDLIRELGIPPDKIKCTIMGESGVDIQDYSDTLPVSIECKAVEKLNIWDALKQAEENTPLLKYPCVVFKRNHSDVYAAVRWDYLLWLLKIDKESRAEKLKTCLSSKGEIVTWNDQKVKE